MKIQGFGLIYFFRLLFFSIFLILLIQILKYYRCYFIQYISQLGFHMTQRSQAKFKYGLKNASSFLQQFKRDRQSNIQNYTDSVNEKEKTFDNEELSSEKQSPESYKFHKKKEFSPQVVNNKIHMNSLVTSVQNEKMTIENFNQQALITYHDQKPGLADLVVKDHLIKTLKQYNEDLDQLEENKQNLIEAIEELSIKIKSLNDLQEKNKVMELENFKNKKDLISMLKQYHQLKIKLVKKKVKSQQNFQKKKQKIKTLLDIFYPDVEYIVEQQSWALYTASLRENKSINIQFPQEKKVLDEIFTKVSEQQQGDKKKGKNLDKSNLLGDLKSFAKNFKMPTGSSNQI